MLRLLKQVPFFLICPLIDSPRILNVYPRPCFVPYSGFQRVILNYDGVARLILYPKAEASAVIPDILIHFRRLDQARSLGSRSGHQRTGGRPARNLPVSFALFLSPSTSSWSVNRWRMGSTQRNPVWFTESSPAYVWPRCSSMTSRQRLPA